jgi:hypothetical protein
VSRKFTEKLDDFHQNNESMHSLVDQSGFSAMINSQLSLRSKAKRQTLINWTAVTCFYEDSEGDMNVISEDEDLVDAQRYYESKRLKRLELSILDKEHYKQFREEQDRNPLNQSLSWIDSDLNLFSNKARKDRNQAKKKQESEQREEFKGKVRTDALNNSVF